MRASFFVFNIFKSRDVEKKQKCTFPFCHFVSISVLIFSVVGKMNFPHHVYVILTLQTSFYASQIVI